MEQDIISKQESSESLKIKLIADQEGGGRKLMLRICSWRRRWRRGLVGWDGSGWEDAGA